MPQKRLRLKTATEEDRRYLNLPEGAMVVVVRSCSSLADTRKFQYTESRHRADRFQVPRLRPARTTIEREQARLETGM